MRLVEKALIFSIESRVVSYDSINRAKYVWRLHGASAGAIGCLLLSSLNTEFAQIDLWTSQLIIVTFDANGTQDG